MRTTTLFIGQNLMELESVDSTSTYLANWLQHSKLPEGTVVWAHQQTKGRGQRGTTWVSKPGQNLTFSCILYPHFISLDNQFILSKAIALALVDCLGKFLPYADIAIKWPNDIYVDQRKIAGILIENSITRSLFSHSIVGIGLNVNQEVFDINAPNATSMHLSANGRWFEKSEVLQQLLTCLEIRYLQIKARHYGLLNETYKKQLYRLNEWHTYLVDNRSISGRILDVNERGLLLLETGEKEIKEFNIKEIVFGA